MKVISNLVHYSSHADEREIYAQEHVASGSSGSDDRPKMAPPTTMHLLSLQLATVISAQIASRVGPFLLKASGCAQLLKLARNYQRLFPDPDLLSAPDIDARQRRVPRPSLVGDKPNLQP